MSEKPITQRIKDRLAAYTAMLRDIDNQLERLDRMEMTMASRIRHTIRPHRHDGGAENGARGTDRPAQG